MKIHQVNLLLIGCLGPMVLLGCGSGGPETIPVFGTVTFEGRERPEACRLFFRPIESTGAARPAVSQTAEDGTYEVKAFKNAEGLLPGTYSLNVSYIDVKPGADPSVESNWISQSFDAGEVSVPADSDEVEHNITVPKSPRAG